MNLKGTLTIFRRLRDAKYTTSYRPVRNNTKADAAQINHGTEGADQFIILNIINPEMLFLYLLYFPITIWVVDPESQLEKPNHKLSLYLLNGTGVSISLGLSISKTPPYTYMSSIVTPLQCVLISWLSLFCRNSRRE